MSFALSFLSCYKRKLSNKGNSLLMKNRRGISVQEGERGVKIRPSYFDYGGEIDVCYTFRVGDKPARLCIRKAKDYFELYARTYYPIPPIETVISQGSLEKVVKETNALMIGYFGPRWEVDMIESNGLP
jgi:hypothetical protein